MMRWLLGGLLALVGLAALLAGGAYFALKRPDIPSASLHTWEPWVQRLGDRYRIVPLDLPGHGLTRAPAGYQASMEAFRDIVAEFVRAQGLSRFALAGSSMGGNVAWEYALAHPEQVEALILVDSSGWDQSSDAEEPTVFKLLRNPVIGPVLRDLDSTRLVRQGLEASFSDDAFVDDAMVTRYTELARALLDVARFWLDRGVDGLRLDVVNFWVHDAQLRDNPALNLARAWTLPPRTTPWRKQQPLLAALATASISGGVGHGPQGRPATDAAVRPCRSR